MLFNYYLDYFKDESSMIIFCLLELDGKEKLKKLKIEKMHYYNKDVAKMWKDDLLKILSESEHINKNEAIKEIEEMYNEMIK